MKNRYKWYIGCIASSAMIWMLTAGGDVAWASEQAGNWRGTYDIVMKWINFGILAFLIYKFGKAPIMNFLRGQQSEISDQIRRIEKEKEAITDQIQETFKTLEETEDRFEKMKQRIVEAGEKEKARIIESAREQGRSMLESSKQKAQSRILTAKDEFRAELIDAAMETALERLPGIITQEDNDKMVAQYLTAAAK